jgi:hypothetical protein
VSFENEAQKGERTMGMSKKAVVLLIPSLWFGFGAPAWSGTADQAAPANAQVMPANPQGNTLLGILNGVLTATDPAPRQPKSQCKASHMYSQHDVVGDPEACIKGSYTLGNGSMAIGSVP